MFWVLAIPEEFASAGADKCDYRVVKRFKIHDVSTGV
jgi:hypothetical protein